jgi:pantoate--beta-alanine ligase
VSTVVAKLLNIVGPRRLYLGQKDAQQNAVISRLIEDLSFDVSIVVCPTVREPDGLALSSRNANLTSSERAAATVLYRALLAGQESLAAGAAPEGAEARMHEVLGAQEGVEPDYARAVDPVSFQVPAPGETVLLVVAARLGAARLIDNLIVTPEGG